MLYAVVVVSAAVALWLLLLVKAIITFLIATLSNRYGRNCCLACAFFMHWCKNVGSLDHWDGIYHMDSMKVMPEYQFDSCKYI